MAERGWCVQSAGIHCRVCDFVIRSRSPTEITSTAGSSPVDGVFPVIRTSDERLRIPLAGPRGHLAAVMGAAEVELPPTQPIDIAHLVRDYLLLVALNTADVVGIMDPLLTPKTGLAETAHPVLQWYSDGGAFLAREAVEPKPQPSGTPARAPEHVRPVRRSSPELPVFRDQSAASSR